MYRDEIITEVWRNRDDYATEHHHDLAQIVDDLRRKQRHPHSKLVDRRMDKPHVPALAGSRQ